MKKHGSTLRPPGASRFVKGAAAAVKNNRAEYVRQHDKSRTLLSPDDIVGKYDASRLLMTTIGGSPRNITDADLRAFATNAMELGDRFDGGITPRGVIDHSRDDDIQRARAQIRYAVPARHKASQIIFVTDAGPDSKAHRHFVTVELVNFSAAVAMPRKPGPLADELTREQVRIDCDCMHWRYRFRYIATVGKYNATIAEWGFPKWTNPHLTGCACKHVLRVMVALREGQVRNYISKMIERSRETTVAKVSAVDTQDASAVMQAQAKRLSPITVSPEKRASSKSRVQLRALAKGAVEKHQAMSKSDARKAAIHVRGLLELGAITQKQSERMLAGIR